MWRREAGVAERICRGSCRIYGNLGSICRAVDLLLQVDLGSVIRDGRMRSAAIGALMSRKMGFVPHFDFARGRIKTAEECEPRARVHKILRKIEPIWMSATTGAVVAAIPKSA